MGFLVMSINGKQGDNHCAWLYPNGEVWTVGQGEEGQLGHGYGRNYATPTDVIMGYTVKRKPQRVNLPPCVQVSAGSAHTACVTDSRYVFCWGDNSEGQMGQGHQEGLDAPHVVLGLPPIRSVVCGDYSTMCIAHDYSIWGFGQNEHGQLGLGHRRETFLPARMENVKGRQLDCSMTHCLILGLDGKVYGCGQGGMGELGSVGSTAVPKLIPLPFEEAVDSVYCGFSFSVIRTVDGALWTSGYNAFGQLGRDTRGKETQKEFKKVPGVVSTQVAVSAHHVVAIDAEHRLWGWGINRNKELSPNPPSELVSPTILRTDAKVVLAGAGSTIVRTTDDRVFVCGCSNEHLCTDTPSGEHLIDWTVSHLPAHAVHISRPLLGPKASR